MQPRLVSIEAKTGFPMLWIEAIGAYVHWLPVTKVQFEYFLCDVNDRQFDEQWYGTLLDLNGRVSPADVRSINYWQAFLTGVRPSEALRYARWSGEGYSLPTLDEWLTMFKSLQAEQPLDPTKILGQLELNERAETLLKQLEIASLEAFTRLGHRLTRAEQMLLRLGVLEWVECPGQAVRWGGMGELNPSFHSLLFSPEAGQPRCPRDPEGERARYYGFRLIRRVS